MELYNYLRKTIPVSIIIILGLLLYQAINLYKDLNYQYVELISEGDSYENFFKGKSFHRKEILDASSSITLLTKDTLGIRAGDHKFLIVANDKIVIDLGYDDAVYLDSSLENAYIIDIDRSSRTELEFHHEISGFAQEIKGYRGNRMSVKKLIEEYFITGKWLNN